MDFGGVVILIMMLGIVLESIRTTLLGMGKVKNKKGFSKRKLNFLKYAGAITTIVTAFLTILWIVVYFDTYV